MDDAFMKAATVVAVALAALSSFPSTAEQQSQQVQSASAPSQQNAAGSQSGSAAELRPVSGELLNKLDSRSAKQGDSVAVKTDEDVVFPGGSDIPRGSKLVGHITNVETRTDAKENSQIAIQFDRAEMKDGHSIAIESVIRSIGPAANAGASIENSIPGSYGPGTQGTQSGVATSNASGTSTAAGTPGSNGATPSAANNRGAAGSNMAAQPEATDRTGGASAPTNNSSMPGSIVARNGNVAIRMTAIPGVLLANDIHGLPFTNASGMLLGARRDIQLDGGTQMVVAIAAAPQGAGGGMSR